MEAVLQLSFQYQCTKQDVLTILFTLSHRTNSNMYFCYLSLVSWFWVALKLFFYITGFVATSVLILCMIFLPRCNALQFPWPAFILSILDCSPILSRAFWILKLFMKYFAACVLEDNYEQFGDCLSYLLNVSGQISSIYLYTFLLFPDFKWKHNNRSYIITICVMSLAFIYPPIHPLLSV